jgi:hypothetical protein
MMANRAVAGIKRVSEILATHEKRISPKNGLGSSNMTRETFEETLELFLERRPFKVFVVELNSGERFEIDSPHATAHREGKAVFNGPGGVLRIFDNESVLQIIDAPAHAIRSKKPKK